MLAEFDGADTAGDALGAGRDAAFSALEVEVCATPAGKGDEMRCGDQDRVSLHAGGCAELSAPDESICIACAVSTILDLKARVTGMNDTNRFNGGVSVTHAGTHTLRKAIERILKNLFENRLWLG